jgi:hypothetical protein
MMKEVEPLRGAFLVRAVLVVVGLLLPSVAGATTYCLAEASMGDAGLDEATSRTFLSLLAGEVVSRGHTWVDVREATGEDPGCDVNVVLTAGRLGERLFVQLSWSGAEQGAAQQTANRPEELDTVAAALATGLVTGLEGDRAARLGEVTETAAAVDRRMELEGGFAFTLGAHVPLAGAYNDALVGPGVGLGYAAEARKFALGIMTGFRWAADGENDGEDRMFMWNTDISGVWLPSTGVVSPMLGGGVGLRYASAPRVLEDESGESLVVTQTYEDLQSGWGMGVFGRAGVLLLRTYKVRVGVHVDVDLMVVPIGSMSVQPSVVAGMSMYF